MSILYSEDTIPCRGVSCVVFVATLPKGNVQNCSALFVPSAIIIEMFFRTENKLILFLSAFRKENYLLFLDQNIETKKFFLEYLGKTKSLLLRATFRYFSFAIRCKI